MIGAFIGGLVGGVIGAGIWAAIVYFTGFEIGIVAWGIGLLVGFGALVLSGGRAGAAGGVIAAVLALGAVLLGKVLVVMVHFGDAAITMQSVTQTLSPFDALWAFLAVGTAFQLARGQQGVAADEPNQAA
jgi:hypothetical protein